MRKYRKNDWWDLMIVIEQELERDPSYKTFLNLADELKWRLVESISEGGNHKIRVKAKELKEVFNTSSLSETVSDQELQEIMAIFDFILIKKQI